MDIVLLFSHAKAWAWLSPACLLYARGMVFTCLHLVAVGLPRVVSITQPLLQSPTPARNQPQLLPCLFLPHERALSPSSRHGCLQKKHTPRHPFPFPCKATLAHTCRSCRRHTSVPPARSTPRYCPFVSISATTTKSMLFHARHKW